MNDVDLSGLRIDAPATAVPRRPLGPRLLVFAVAAIAIAVAATFLVPLLLPPRAVRTAPVVSAQTGAARSTSATAEAVGWVEADPFPYIVRPLVSGHIETLDVLEGATVVADETVIATLASAELQAALDRTSAAVAVAQAAVARARADAELADARLEQNADALLRVRDARTKLAAIETRLQNAEQRRREDEAKARSAAANVRAQELLAEAGTSHPVALERARADADAAKAAVEARDAELAGLRGERDAQRETLALSEQLAAEPVDLRGAVAIATAALQQAESAHRQAETDREIAAREFGWATIRSPVGGVVMRLEAEPGDMVGHGQSGVVALYDPQKLRARIDVPLDSIGGVREGQRVEVTSEAIGDVVVQGVVQRLQHETDLLKNTLQVKVGLTDPPALLRPETLCRARFLAPESDATDAPRVVTAFRVPASAVQDGRVFVFDPQRGAARAVAVEVVGEQQGERVVRGELSPTQRVVLDPVTDGERITEIRR